MWKFSDNIASAGKLVDRVRGECWSGVVCGFITFEVLQGTMCFLVYLVRDSVGLVCRPLSPVVLLLPPPSWQDIIQVIHPGLLHFHPFYSHTIYPPPPSIMLLAIYMYAVVGRYVFYHLWRSFQSLAGCFLFPALISTIVPTCLHIYSRDLFFCFCTAMYNETFFHIRIKIRNLI